MRLIKSTWYDWLINYILEPARKRVGDFKGKFVGLFKTNTPKQIVYGKGKIPTKPKRQNIQEKQKLRKIRKAVNDRIIRDIWTLVETEEEKQERKQLDKLDQKKGT